MKTIPYISSALIAVGTPGVSLLTLGGLIPAAYGFAAVIALGFAGLMLFDYARPVRSLKSRTPVLRPALPAQADCSLPCSARRAA